MWPIKHVFQSAKPFSGWKAEALNVERLGGIYGSNPEQLNRLWQRLPEDLKHDRSVRSTIALCHLRLASNESAFAIDPESFVCDPSQAISNAWALRLTKLLLALYLRKLALIYLPLAGVLHVYFRRFSDEQLLLNMYFRVFGDNTAGLRCMLPLFIRCLLRREGPDRLRYMSFFGYICALNSVLDDGIALQEKVIAKFRGAKDEHPKSFWFQEMSLLLGLSRYYNMDYQLASEQFRAVAQLSEKQSFIFVQTLNYASWLRLAVLTMDKSVGDISSKLQGVFSEDYDRRYALRTHSYRSLVAARHGDKQLSLRELAIANSIAVPGLNQVETCNTECLSHLGVTAKVYLYNHDARKALTVAERYLTLLTRFSSLSLFAWEANLLILKLILVIRARNPGGMLDQRRLLMLRRKVAKNLKPLLPLSQNWRHFYHDLSSLADGVTSLSAAAFDRQIETLAKRYAGQLDEVRTYLSQTSSEQGTAESDRFEKTAQATTEVLKVNYSLLSFTSAIKAFPLSDLDGGKLAQLASGFFEALMPGCTVTATDAEAPFLAMTLAPGVTERSSIGGFELHVAIERADRPSPMRLWVRGYAEALNFRRDLLAAFILWKEITEGSVRDKVMVKREVQHEKTKAIAQTVQMLAHDVRKPFSLLRTGISMLSSVEDTGTMQDILEKFVPEVDRALLNVNGLIQDVMEVGTDHAHINPQDSSIVAMVDRSLHEILKIHPRALLDISFSWGHSTMLAVDPIKVDRVLSNIIGNAVEAMKKKGVMWFRSVQRGDKVEVCIGNAGSYISDEHIPKLFDAFFTRKKRGGTGLGLAIAKKIVESHGGAIWCESKHDESCPDGQVEFIFTLPAARTLDANNLAMNPRLLSQPSVVGGARRPRPAIKVTTDDPVEVDLEEQLCRRQQLLGRPVKILIVDDEDLFRRGLNDFFRRSEALSQAVFIAEARSAGEALALVRDDDFDLIMTDIDLGPKSADGYALIRDLRYTRAANAFICVHSNRIVPSDYRSSVLAGAETFLPKPLARAQMLRLVLQSISHVGSWRVESSLDRDAINTDGIHV